jgi:hypothetical protein
MGEREHPGARWEFCWGLLDVNSYRTNFATMVILKDTAAQTTENSNGLGKSEDVHKKENLVATEYNEARSNGGCVEELQSTDLASAQEISARNIDPMKLIMLLQVRFGIGRY